MIIRNAEDGASSKPMAHQAPHAECPHGVALSSLLHYPIYYIKVSVGVSAD